MRFPPLQKSAALHLAWIGGLCGAVILMLADFLPYRLPFAGPDGFFAAVLSLELFFVLLVWPLFVPSLLREGIPAPMVLIEVAVLLLFGLPLVLIAANVTGVDAGSVLRGQVLVAALAALGAGVAARFRPALPWYYLAAFWLSAAHPFWAFLGDQMGAASPRISVYLSPFWGAVARDASPAWVQAAVYGLGGVALLALPSRKAAA
ncbi:MAG TPA: hypothetical protein VNM14_12785 [Planctomycetota bacterium]|jgi:hypothetical protein|nr:hypothetical protein [Planctomycetota bacterium]